MPEPEAPEAEVHLKICGLRDPVQARQVAALGVEAIGVIAVASSPRFVTISERGPLFAAIAAAAPSTERVLVLADPNSEELAALEEETGATVLQLHGQETPEQCSTLRQRLQKPIWKALRIRQPADLERAQAYIGTVDALLLDAWVPDQLGGSGARIPIEWLQAFAPDLPWWLAGGVSAARVETILQSLRPWGLDASSSVERAPADKDLTRVRELVDAVRRAEARAAGRS
ncbi:MAG: phosphoribosylanthranilate isomerase [Cyanobacteriota bacterium]